MSLDQGHPSCVTREQDGNVAKKNKSDASDRPLSALMRIYIYGIHGILVEVLFTSGFDLVVDILKNKEGINFKLPGYSTIWSVFIYGIALFVTEKLSVMLSSRGISRFFRCFLYVAWAFTWEFSCGLLLRQFDACLWDYTEHTNYNVYGLIAFDYAPFWYLLGFMFELYLMPFTLSLKWADVQPMRD